MADTSSTIRIIFDGTATGVVAAARVASTAVSGVTGALTKLGAAGGGIQAIGGAVAALQQLAGAALLLPAAIGAFAAAKTTFIVATQGFADAVGGDAEAMKSLSPAAREAAQAMQALRDGPFRELQQAVQERFFEGFAANIQTLSDTFLPSLQTGMVEVADAFKQVRVASVAAFALPENAGALEIIFRNTALSIRQNASALGDFATGFVQLGAIGSQFLPGLTAGLDTLAAKFRTFVTENPEQIREMIRTALDAFGDLFQIVGNIAGAVGAIFRGLAGDVATPLQGIVELTGRLREFFETAEAQTALSALGNALRVVSQVVGDLLIGALKAVAPIVTALTPLIVGLAQTFGTIGQAIIDTLGPALLTVVQALSDALLPVLPIVAEAFAGLVRAMGPVIEALAGPLARILAVVIQLFADIVIALTPVISALTPVIELIGNALAEALERIGPMLADVAGILADAFVLAIETLAPLMPPLVDAFLRLIDALIPLVPPLVELAVNLLPFFTISVQVAIPIIIGLVNALTILFETFGPLILAVLDFVNNALSAMNNLGPEVSRIIATMVTEVTTFFTTMFTEGQRIVGELVAAVTTFFTDMQTTVSDIAGALTDAVTGFFQEMGTNIENFVGDMVTAVTQFFRNMQTDAVAAARQLVDDAIAAVGRLFDGFVSAARRAVDGFVQGIRDGIGRAGAAARDLANAALEALGVPFEFGSPSKVTAQMGLFVGQGLASGIDASVPGIIESARAAAEAARGALAEPLSEPFPDLTVSTATSSALSSLDGVLAAQLDLRNGGGQAEFLRQLAALLDDRPVQVNVDLDGDPVRAMVRTGLAEQDRESARTLKVGPGVSW